MGEPEPSNPHWRDGKTGRFLPGNKASPGRGPKVSLSEVLREHIDSDELAKALLKLIRKGELAAITYAYNRLEGMPKQAIDQTVREEPPAVSAIAELQERLRLVDKEAS